jgi:DNA-3-methyladenine glycosylase
MDPDAIQAAGGLSCRALIRQTRAVPREFYSRPAPEVARALLGKLLVNRGAAGRIVEVEAYLGEDDPAAHAWRGLTPRTRVLFGPPGHAYVYLIYGMYECLNVVAEPEGSPGCVLIRALEPLCGLARMRRRRPGIRRREDLASGPGKLTLAMGITRRMNGADLVSGPLQIRAFDPEPPLAVIATPRVGIRHASDRLLRFAVDGSRYVSR